jgi:hypothetical protein
LCVFWKTGAAFLKSSPSKLAGAEAVTLDDLDMDAVVEAINALKTLDKGPKLVDSRARRKAG